MPLQFRSLLLCVLLLLLGFALANTNAARTYPPVICATLNRTNFDTLIPGFAFGAATASYQVEGAARIDGRGPSIWDVFTHNYPEKIKDGSNGDVATDQYHRYKDMGLDAYRFSISWSRLLPRGTLSGGINKKGVQYYNNLINELIRNGIDPLATLFHWDVPQALQEEYGGVLSRRFVDDFRAYADFCYKKFGDRVKHWVTINEGYTISNLGFTVGTHAPGRCSSWYDPTCLGGDSATEPYLVTHNLLLAHAAAVKLYREKYQASQGMIGITVGSYWYEPASESQKDIDASVRALDFVYGWFMDPLTRGDYPQNMRFLLKERLPNFTEEESESLIGSYDYIGVNYYSARYASAYPEDYSISTPPSYLTDAYVNVTTELNGIPIGPQSASEWLYVYPKGLYDLVLYTKKKYNDPLMYITENGMDEFNNPELSLEQALDDSNRIDYYYRHLCYLQEAIREGANVQGFFPWSLLDNFEWNVGYTVRFGINYVDFDNGLKRYPKHSTHWFKNFLKRSSISKEKIRRCGNNNARPRKFVHQI